MALVLQVLQGPDRGRRFELPGNEPQLVGRSSEALPLTDSTVSRRHAELTPDDGRWFLRDLDSANGTYVNGRRITERVPLDPGDQVKCGSTILLVTTTRGPVRSDAVRVLAPDAFDVTVEGTVDANADSMILAAPDPVKAATDHLRLVYELSAITAVVHDRDELLEKVMDLVFREFQPDRGFILLMDGPDAPPEPAVVRYRQKPKSLDEGRIPVSRTIIRHTLERGEGVLSTNAMNDQRFSAGDSVRDYGIRSAICVPILSGTRTFGVIHIDSSLANFTFNDSQLRLLNAVGQQTGLAMRSLERFDSRMQTERLAATGQAVASLSHSIKNILQGLRGGADAVALALDRGDLDLAQQGWPILGRNLDRIYALTLNMLTFSRPQQLEIELVPLAPLVEEVLALLRDRIERKRIAVLCEFDEHMPPVPVDGNALHQAIMNLVANAVDALPGRGGLITVTTQYRSDSGHATVTVTDNGPGVPPERGDEIFEPFTTTKGQRGTGLGLAVTRKIVEEHGGRVLLESTPGAGASFTIELPLERPTRDPAETSLPRPRPSDALGEF